MGPIRRATQIITQEFKGLPHRGIDLRCVRFPGEPGTLPTWRNQYVIATEKCIVQRMGVDVFKNNFLVVEPLKTHIFGYTDIKYIHIEPVEFKFGQILEEGDVIGKCMIGGNSKDLHLHFETWKGDKPIDPIEYFHIMQISYRFK